MMWFKAVLSALAVMFLENTIICSIVPIIFAGDYLGKIDNSFNLALEIGQLSLQDCEFVENVLLDIKGFIKKNKFSQSVLLFPPVNNFKRFLIHKVVEETFKAEELHTFSVGKDFSRRTVVVSKSHLDKLALKCGNTLTAEDFTILKHQDLSNEVTNLAAIKRRNNLSANLNIYRPPHCRQFHGNMIIANDEKPVNTRRGKQRRPDQQVYVPRPKRVNYDIDSRLPTDRVGIRRQPVTATKCYSGQVLSDAGVVCVGSLHSSSSQDSQDSCLLLPQASKETITIEENVNKLVKEKVSLSILSVDSTVDDKPKATPDPLKCSSQDGNAVSVQSFVTHNKNDRNGREHNRGRDYLSQKHTLSKSSVEFRIEEPSTDHRKECNHQTTEFTCVTTSKVWPNVAVDIEDHVSVTSLSCNVNLRPESSSRVIDKPNVERNNFCLNEVDPQKKNFTDIEIKVPMDTCALSNLINKESVDCKSIGVDKKCNSKVVGCSKECNIKNRRIFHTEPAVSDVLTISDVDIPSSDFSLDDCDSSKKHKDIDTLLHPESSERISIMSDDWENLYDEQGECLEPGLMEELTRSVGKVGIAYAASDYRPYQTPEERSTDGESILEIFGFPSAFKTHDLFNIFSAYLTRGFDIKWVDDTHALGIFCSPLVADEVLASDLPFVKTRPLRLGLAQSRVKARALVLPPAARPKTCPALARRLVTGALGLRVPVTPKERAHEKLLLKEARDKKRLAAKQRDAAWEGTLKSETQ